jgi:hypothetical protein
MFDSSLSCWQALSDWGIVTFSPRRLNMKVDGPDSESNGWWTVVSWCDIGVEGRNGELELLGEMCE